MQRLQKLAAVFVGEGELGPVLEEVVEVAVAITEADFGNLQLLDPDSGDLRIVAQRGFPERWLEFWGSVAEGQGACGTALETKQRVIVEDVEQSPIFIGTEALEVQLRAGVRSVQSTPLFTRAGEPLGVVSTHFRAPHKLDERTLALLDLLARQTADMIARTRAEQALRESERELAAELAAARVLQRLSTRPIGSDEARNFFDDLLDAAVEALHADFASVQLFHPERGPDGELELLRHRGFTGEAEKFWEWVTPSSKSTCGLALSSRQRAAVSDIELSEEMAGSTDQITYLDLGIHAVQTTPIVARSGALLGVFSTHWRERHELTESEQRTLDALVRQAGEVMEHRRAQRALLEREAEKAAQAERSRLARDLHDSVTQALFAANLKAEALTSLPDLDAPATSLALDMHRLSRGALAQMRTLLLELRGDPLAGIALRQLFAHLLEAAQGRTSAMIDLEIEGKAELPAAVHEAVYRIAQEALNNVAKHAGASEAKVSLVLEDHKALLVVSDDGRGFDSRSVSPEHMGLRSMSERAAEAGALLTVESVLGRGTTVRLEWPGEVED